MTMPKTLPELYNCLLEEYGKRRCWISDLARKLGLSYAETNHLTWVLGYRRGRALSITTLEDFSSDLGVQRVVKQIASRDEG